LKSFSFLRFSSRFVVFNAALRGGVFVCHAALRKPIAMPDAPLTRDCDRCAALCCVAVAFDRSESFAFDKAADTPCRNLDRAHGCTIHARLAGSGFAGCAAYDCHGAGQVVTQELFGGRSWRDDAALLPAMSEAFRLLRRVHGLRLLLHEAHGLPLDSGAMRRIEALDRALGADGAWTLAALRELALDELDAEVRLFLRGLAPANRDLRPRMQDHASDAAA
jgi:hypothetical protein